jgi:hypothetical protein
VAKKNINLNNAQKDEIRRLTQLANRRIRAAEKAYRQAGKHIVPKEIAGHVQLKSQWHTSTTPLSRSVKFNSAAEYRKQLQFLRSFEVTRPGIKEYTKIQHQKTIEAVETSLGLPIEKELAKKIENLSAPELGEFWNNFSDKASKMGIKYASDAAMLNNLTEFFSEDKAFVEDLLGTFTRFGRG